MKVVDIADEIHRELSSPTDISVPAIVFWLVRNIGGLNNYIDKSYVIDDATVEISPELGEAEKYIFKKMYFIHFYEVKLRASIASVLTDEVMVVSDQGSTVKKLNKNEISKHFAAIKNKEVEELRALAVSYRSAGVTPLQVAGDDTIEGTFSTDSVSNRD